MVRRRGFALLKGPDLHTVDVEVLLGGERLVVEGGAAAGGAPIQLSIQPQAQLTPGVEQRGDGEEGGRR